jgi:hypothetical protein
MNRVRRRLRHRLPDRLQAGLTLWPALLLAALLLVAQAAGLAHRVAHGLPAHAQDGSHATVNPVADHWGHAPADAHGGVSSDCRLYDQLLGHADALLASLPPAPLPVAAPRTAVPELAAFGRANAAAYQARAPPAG